MSLKRIAGVGATALVAGALSWAGGFLGGSDPLAPEPARAADLEPFGSCDELLDYAHEHRWARRPGYYPGGPVLRDDVRFAVAERAGGALADSGASRDLGPGATGTNVQEAGIDEPDVAKLDGETLFALSRDGLESFAVGGSKPVALGRVELPGRGHSYPPPQLLIGGDRALVIAGFHERRSWEPRTRLVEIDISDPAAMSVVRTAEIEGSQVSARLQGSTAHLVLASTPDYPKPAATEPPDAGATGETGPTDGESGELPSWLPQATLTDPASGERTAEPLFGCDAVRFPRDFAGLDLLSVLTIDLTRGLPAVDTDVVMSSGTTVYASDSGLYVAAPALRKPRTGSIGRILGPGNDIAPPLPVPPGETTIHRFETADPLDPRYAASGEVDGRLLGQFAMSEHEGFLRIASTEGNPWADGRRESESAVTVLAERDGELRRVGGVGGLGRGEEIYAVRFIGDLGYVITFEQTDPLYTIDLSAPSAPKATGELKIPGYSAYLHPVADGLLLGIGQDGTDDGRTTGAQASLFDVSDPASPQRTDELALSRGRWSSAATERTHHAFLYSPDRELAVVPVNDYGRDGFRGAVAVEVDPRGRLGELSRLEDPGGQIRRMLIVGERLVTLSRQGVATRDLETFERTGSAAFTGD